MMKYFFLGLIILFAIDGIFLDGYLIVVFFRQDIFIPSLFKLFLFIIGAVASILLFHSVIWDLCLHEKPETKKTEYQKELEEAEELERLEKEKEEQDKAALAKRKYSR